MWTPIHHIFGPLADSVQTWEACKLLLGIRNKSATEQLQHALSKQFEHTALYTSGRQGLLALLQSMQLKAGAEIIIQGYTCMAVPNAIHAAGGTPVYVDIEKDSLNLNVKKVETAITHRTRAVICQHTFGISADTKALRALCDTHSILLIEDCAHIMPDQKGPTDIAKHGDVMLFSFGRDKAISGISGGALCSAHTDIINTLETQLKRAPTLSTRTIRTLLFYPIIYTLCRPIYGIGLGKALLKLCALLRLLPAVTIAKEKDGYMEPIVQPLPPALATLAYTQFNQLETINNHRRMLTAYYLNIAKEKNWTIPGDITVDMPLQKFPLYTHKAEEIRQTLKANNIYLDDGWTGSVICPRSSNSEAAGYTSGQTPIAEEVGITILSLPTHPQMTAKNAERLVELLSPLLAHD